MTGRKKITLRPGEWTQVTELRSARACLQSLRNWKEISIFPIWPRAFHRLDLFSLWTHFTRRRFRVAFCVFWCCCSSGESWLLHLVLRGAIVIFCASQRAVLSPPKYKRVFFSALLGLARACERASSWWSVRGGILLASWSRVDPLGEISRRGVFPPCGLLSRTGSLSRSFADPPPHLLSASLLS